MSTKFNNVSKSNVASSGIEDVTTIVVACIVGLVITSITGAVIYGIKKGCQISVGFKHTNGPKSSEFKFDVNPVGIS